ncbi:MAG: antitoxin, partial [Dolichospermum sp.]
MSRLSIDVTDQQHQSLKVLAAPQGKTIKEYATERLFPSGSEEQTALNELKSLLAVRIT